MTADAPTERILDVREVDGEPFRHIVSALDELPDDGRLVLLNSFEPRPLYGVLEERGFSYEATQAAPDEWRVVVEHA